MQIQFTRRKKILEEHIDNNYLAPDIKYFAWICITFQQQADAGLGLHYSNSG